MEVIRKLQNEYNQPDMELAGACLEIAKKLTVNRYLDELVNEEIKPQSK